MAALTAQQLFDAYPELTTAVAGELTTIATLSTVVEQQVVQSMYADTETWEQARRALLGHLWTLVNPACQGGKQKPVGQQTGRTRGSQSVTHQAAKGWLEEDILLSTPYGQVYALLRRGSLARLPRVY